MYFRKFVLLFVPVLLITSLIYWARWNDVEDADPVFIEENTAIVGRSRFVQDANSETVGQSVDEFIPETGSQAFVESIESTSVFDEGPLLDFELVSAYGPSESDAHGHVIDQWRGRFQPSIDENLLNQGGEGRVSLSLPDGQRIDIRIDQHRVLGESRGVYTGRIENSAGGSVFFSYAGRAVSGTLQDVERQETWDIRNAGDGEQYLALVDLDSLGSCVVCSPKK